jgi:hypothetical protein
MKTITPLKFKRLASDWKTEMAELGAWVPMEDEPMEIVRQLVAFFVHEALLNMRRPPNERP